MSDEGRTGKPGNKAEGSSVGRVSNESGDEVGGDTFCAAAQLADGQVAREILLVNTFNGRQKIANSCNALR